ncbi:MAG: hypothetical protein GXN91_02000, partial [Epsilonproteobacteria bacterium]|nr:hypothetical protein [Campylobacterota bacterium]
EHGDSFHYKDPINRFIKKKMFECKLSLYKRDKRRYPKIRNLYYIIKPLLKFVLYHSFINYMVKRARERGCEAIVCGHLHLPQIKEIKGIKYINSGDWVKHLSYIVEDKDGEFKLKYFKDIK